MKSAKRVRFFGIRIRKRMTRTAERICAKFTWKTCLVLRWDDFNVKVKSERSKSPRTKNALCRPTHNTPAVWTKWNALVADSVAQAADATIRSLHRMSSPGCVRWTWRATAGLCHAFLVMVALCNRADHYIFAVVTIFLSFLFPRLISAAGDWRSIILPVPHMAWP